MKALKMTAKKAPAKKTTAKKAPTKKIIPVQTKYGLTGLMVWMR